MSRTGISYHDVANAAAKVQGYNENPTVDRIREILGTGSKSTIARHLKDWKANNGPIANAKGLPPELIAIVTGLWERIQRSAEEEILEFRQEANQKIQTAETNFKQSQKMIVDLQGQVHQLEESLFQQKDTIKGLECCLSEEHLTSSKQQGQISSLEEHLNVQKQENTKLHSLLKNIQNNLEHYQASMQKLQQEQSLALEKQKNLYEQEISGLRHQLFEAANAENSIKLQNKQFKEQLLGLEHLKNHSQMLEKTLKEKEIQVVILEEKHTEVLNKNEKITRTLEIKVNMLIDAEQKTAIACSRVNDLEKVLQQANDKISTLRHEQQFIAQEKANIEGQLKQLKESSKIEMVEV